MESLSIPPSRAGRDAWLEHETRGKGAQNSPPPYWKQSSSYNRAALLNVFLKDSSECMLRLDAKFADIEQGEKEISDKLLI